MSAEQLISHTHPSEQRSNLLRDLMGDDKSVADVLDQPSRVFAYATCDDLMRAVLNRAPEQTKRDATAADLASYAGLSETDARNLSDSMRGKRVQDVLGSGFDYDSMGWEEIGQAILAPRSETYAKCMNSARIVQGFSAITLGAVVAEAFPPAGIFLIAAGADSMRAGYGGDEPLLTKMANMAGIEAWNHKDCVDRTLKAQLNFK